MHVSVTFSVLITQSCDAVVLGSEEQNLATETLVIGEC
jgi:hypothetical protein